MKDRTHAEILSDIAAQVVQGHRGESEVDRYLDREFERSLDEEGDRLSQQIAGSASAPAHHDPMWDWTLPDRYQG